MRLALGLAFGAVALAAGCGGEEHGDLKQELAQLTKDFRGQVPPLPQVKPYEPVPYTAEGQVDPFRQERIEVAQVGTRTSNAASKIAEHEKRIKEPLEAFPLESIQMLGTITQEKETFALVKAGPNLYRVKKGNYMGQNFGLITDVTDGEIKLKEIVQDSAGDWAERQSVLPLLEEAGKGDRK
jgi:type IV pilus assembly protein PilP